MGKMLFSTDQMPAGMEIKTLFNMVQYGGQVEISNKGLIRSIIEKNKKGEYQDIYDTFISLAPDEANAIIGVQIVTAAQGFNNGAFLYVTYFGTPAIIGDIATTPLE